MRRMRRLNPTYISPTFIASSGSNHDEMCGEVYISLRVLKLVLVCHSFSRATFYNNQDVNEEQQILVIFIITIKKIIK